jgi:hypothetical protein
MSFTFDIAASTLAGTSYLCGWGTSGEITENLVQGLQFFAVATCVNRIAQLALQSPVQVQPAPFIGVIANTIFTEVCYAGILPTQGIVWMIPRFAVSLITGMSATKAVVEIPKDAPAPTLDLKMGFLWGVARETLLQALPKSFSTPLLIITDSGVYALIEMAPLKALPIEARLYTGISSLFFRIIGNVAALKTGIGASFTQHLLFNVSRLAAKID